MAKKGCQGEPLSVLLVEDNVDDEFLAIWALEKAGINQISVAHDGSEALDILARGGTAPDLILLDLRLPKIDGKEVLQRIRADDRTGKLPVLVLTSSEDVCDKEFCYRYGIIDFVSKPLTADYVRRFLGRIE